MNSLQSLSKKIETVLTRKELKESILTAMDKADSIEELLILKWQFNKAYGTATRTVKKDKFYENIERIAYQNALNNSRSIIEDLQSSKTIAEIKDSYYTTTSSIKRVIINFLEHNEEKFLKLISKVENIDVLPEQDREFLCAKTAINMFIQANTVTLHQVSEKFGSKSEDYHNYLKILETRNHPLFFQFQELNHSHFSKTYKIRTDMNLEKEKARKQKRITELLKLDPQEIVKILSNVNTEDFGLFCKAFNFEIRFFTNLLKSDPTLKYKFTNKDTIKETYVEYYLKYQEMIEKLIEEIHVLKETGFKEPLGLYEYYLHNTININYLARMALTFSHIEGRSLILKYIDNFKDQFNPIDKKGIENIKRLGIISCCKRSLKFTNYDIKKALEEMNDKNLPYIKGVLFGAIKKEQELKDTKQKTKR